jgi:hypothetical protein
MTDPRRPPKRGFLAYAERDKERRLANEAGDSADVTVTPSDAIEPATATPNQPKLALDRT